MAVGKVRALVCEIVAAALVKGHDNLHIAVSPDESKWHYGDPCNNYILSLGLGPRLAGARGSAAACFHVGNPCARSDRPADALRLAQRRIGECFIECFAE